MKWKRIKTKVLILDGVSSHSVTIRTTNRGRFQVIIDGRIRKSCTSEEDAKKIASKLLRKSLDHRYQQCHKEMLVLQKQCADLNNPIKGDTLEEIDVPFSDNFKQWLDGHNIDFLDDKYELTSPTKQYYAFCYWEYDSNGTFCDKDELKSMIESCYSDNYQIDSFDLENDKPVGIEITYNIS